MIGNKKKHGKNIGRVRLLALLAVVGAFLFLMAGCGSSDTEEDAAQEETTQVETLGADNWYESILAEASVKDEYPYYRLLDIDQDGTDELFLSTTKKAFIGDEDRAKVMALVDGVPATIKEIGGAGGESFSYDSKDQSLFYYFRLSGESHIVKYAFANGGLTTLRTADEYSANHDPNSGKNSETTYYLDGKKVKEAEADELWDQYEDQAEPITYSKNGKGSPNADDDDE